MIDEILLKHQNSESNPGGIDAIYEVTRILTGCHGLTHFRIEITKAVDKREVFPYAWKLYLWDQKEHARTAPLEIPGTATRTEDLALDKALSYIANHYTSPPEGFAAT
jgi:hypothetical protein